MRDVLISMCDGLLFLTLLYGAAFAYCVLP